MQILSPNDYKMYCSIISLSQKGLKKTLHGYLQKHYPKVVSTKEYLFAAGDIPIALVAHMDTVFNDTPTDIFYDREKNVIWSPQGGCGDDRAGVFAILKILQSKLRPTIIFTTDEECGGLGADALVKDFPECPIPDLRYIIQLDRRGTNDCVFYDCDNSSFVEYVESFGFIENYGSFTDISTICPMWGVAGVNLSVGYENEHSIAETVHVSALLATINKVKNMLKDDKNNLFMYVPSSVSLNYFKYLFPTEEDSFFSSKCTGCGKLFLDYELFPVKDLDGKIKYYCPDCIVNSNIVWCEECGSAFIKDDSTSSLCQDCRGGKNTCSTQKSKSNSTK